MDTLTQEARDALIASSGEDLLRKFAQLTHSMHGQHRIDCADERAQRDLVEAELLRRMGDQS